MLLGASLGPSALPASYDHRTTLYACLMLSAEVSIMVEGTRAMRRLNNSSLWRSFNPLLREDRAGSIAPPAHHSAHREGLELSTGRDPLGTGMRPYGYILAKKQKRSGLNAQRQRFVLKH